MIERLLLVDDDRSLCAVLALSLSEEGFTVDIAPDGADGWRKFLARPPDLAIVDVLMPEMDGLELCRPIRKQSSIPIILLTSRSEEVDRVTGLELGADDYVTKPFSTRELCARIRAIGRRLAQANAAPASRADRAALTIGPLVLDQARFDVRWKGQPVALTKSEFAVLAALAARRGFVLSRDQLIDLARGDDVVTTDRTIDTFVKRIRKKLRELDPSFDAIETITGLGYRYRAPED